MGRWGAGDRSYMDFEWGTTSGMGGKASGLGGGSYYMYFGIEKLWQSQ